jgi:hypothetical protein
MRHVAKRACRHTRVVELHSAGGLGGGLGDARAQEPSWSVVWVPWRQVLGHGIAASAAAACCGMGQRRSGAQQHKGTARSAISG